MGPFHVLFTVSCLYLASATMVNTDNIEMERFTAADSKSGTPRNYRPVQKDNIATPSRTPTIVYGKNKVSKPSIAPYQAPILKNKPKFKPSHEEVNYDDSVNTYAHGYKPTPQETAALQKYMHRYSNQVFHTPKNQQQQQQQQNEHQKQSDSFKKYAAPPAQQKYKFIPVLTSEMKVEKPKEQHTVEIVTEKYPSFVPKTPKSPPKKAYSYDNSQQPSDYKYSSTDSQIASHLLAEPEKSSWSGYEPYQYGVISSDKDSELSKITGYKIPAATSISLGHTVETNEEEKVQEEEHYPDHEPKYEYMYQVHDPEKHNDFGHSEARKGKTTWGRYYVQLPDGRLETVKYWVDKSGYHAEVDFKGQATHPGEKEYTHHEEPQSSYGKTEESSSSSAAAGLSGHSEQSSYGLVEPGEEY